MGLLDLTYVGGPTALLGLRSLRLLTDPTFDLAGAEYRFPVYTLRKTIGPALAVGQLGPIDAVLLSHEHHADNLDAAGRAMAMAAPRVLTTVAGAERLGARAVGLTPWEGTELRAGDGRVLRVTATPARHGPAHLDRGPVIGFALAWADAPGEAIYVSGDTVWYEGVAEVARRFRVRAAVLFLGAARVAAVGPWPLTMTAHDAVEAARAFGEAVIVPLHFEGWEHFSESRAEVEAAFAEAGLRDRLRWPVPGRTIAVA
jgi:L-ascorbate metabolism protein UlaG (beta-lactamase superfamily)